MRFFVKSWGGYSEYPPIFIIEPKIIEGADILMYQAKKESKNRDIIE
jgi:hypothetical protein